MKDYYYILGLKQTATIDEIKKAYRKLSIKFHPDKNDGDEFFTERFKEIQEAYEVLISSQSRANYDRNFTDSNQTGSKNKGYNFDPIIELFKTDKTAFEFEEEIIFSWKTINSDKVTLKPFGIVQPIGQKTYRIKDFKNPILNFELIAENTNIGRQTKQSLKLNNKTFQELYLYFKKIIEAEIILRNNQHRNTQNKNKSNEENHSNRNEFVYIQTDKGLLALEPYTNLKGTRAFLDSRPAPSGKYKIGFLQSIEIKNGIVVSE